MFPEHTQVVAAGPEGLARLSRGGELGRPPVPEDGGGIPLGALGRVGPSALTSPGVAAGSRVCACSQPLYLGTIVLKDFCGKDSFTFFF